MNECLNCLTQDTRLFDQDWIIKKLDFSSIFRTTDPEVKDFGLQALPQQI